MVLPPQRDQRHAFATRLRRFDHQKLTYRYAGRDFRLTDVDGEVVKAILA